MFLTQLFSSSKRAILTLILFSLVTACATEPESQQLRITNSGDTDITGLVVVFPAGQGWDAGISRIEFGDLPAGQTSEYQNVPSGVYRYAAYEYILDGREVRQPVIDWVGEEPMAGKKITYQITLDLNKVTGNQVSLITVLVDEP